MIKNIIFDLGNVIIKGTHTSIVKQFAKNEDENIFIENILLKSPEWNLMELGMITKEEAIIKIQKRNKKIYYNLIETILNEWYKFLEVNEDIVNIAKKLKSQNFKLYVLSNMTEATYLYIKKDEFFKLCDGIVISAYEHLMKPDKKIFEILLKRYNIKADESLFIDDYHLAPNELGILGRKVIPNSKEDVIKILNEFNIRV